MKCRKLNTISELFINKIKISNIERLTNITNIYMRKVKIWKDGICKDCGSSILWSTFICNDDEDTEGDYSVWCSNNKCKNHIREEIYDTDIPEYFKEVL